MSNHNVTAVENLVVKIARLESTKNIVTSVERVPTSAGHEDSTLCFRSEEERIAMDRAFQVLTPYVFGMGQIQAPRLGRWMIIRSTYSLPTGFSWKTAMIAVYMRDELQAQFMDVETLVAQLMSCWTTILCYPETVFTAPS